ncbi:NADH-quinone oxidoreductase, chain I [Geobacter metallireducens RCH3]|uniref:NADH-quinone oxidoreductase subunit I 2 n=1 Tax=Geobacter metallireducens (strain ATCC 53774 / DSM 7210 / GS-15) TaxID=269799 RepID=NUOI2_GEOMG|nr:MULTISPECIES: NADH-quinone oxidoreductase subunit NuoI [Geobacter]Q39QB5.1 RecName: Full=NADH-quinone oxidoreductase subunit I 2; AltName: Full=NADH dehydrogenase I subunit I 2; AltName: Full=NDH-1 subunit I 2 [Geobacter metallireducens GS-15]ABB33559.1 NADH dehydrogenase I, I subunit [Geobacter metallireducens GS-15]EHP87669.1 NADH-quinone oxidoreductase, chain I [Geobacter metallireducens RCH3]MBT1074129.1 NADH-quinone oxidoreductase subunit NuoI [Geobacter grbiciae]
MIMPLINGLKITLKHMFMKPVTLQYPDERPTPSPNFRGLHALKVSHSKAKCVCCYLCPTVCPAKCITVEAGEDQEHNKYAERYEIDMLRCIFCGYCVEACPVDALKMTGEFELANYKREDFVFVKERLLEK